MPRAPRSPASSPRTSVPIARGRVARRHVEPHLDLVPRSRSSSTRKGIRDRGSTHDEHRTSTGSAARAADDKKGEDIVVLDVAEIMGIVDAFVITHASNTRLVRTIVDEVKTQLLEQAGVKPRSVEGLDDLTWVLLDYGDLIVHVFLEETREFYGLERLWTDAPRIVWNGAAATVTASR